MRKVIADLLRAMVEWHVNSSNDDQQSFIIRLKRKDLTIIKLTEKNLQLSDENSKLSDEVELLKAENVKLKDQS